MNLFSTKQLEKFKEQWSYIDKVLLSILFLFLMMLSVFSAMAQAPYIVSMSPSHTETKVSPNVGELVLTLSESVFANPNLADSWDQLRLKNTSNNTIQEFEIHDENELVISGNVITLKNVQTLNYGQTYWVQCYSGGLGMFKDIDGNKLPDFNNSETWEFTTNTSDLLITSTYPSDNATAVHPDPDEDYTITFDGNVNPPTGGLTWNIQIRNADETYWEWYPTNNSTKVSYDGNTLTLLRSGKTPPLGEDLYVIIPSTALEDDNNRDFVGISDPTEWNFTIKTDITSPAIRTLNPENNEQGVDRTTSTFSIQFDEAVSLDTKGSDVVLYHREGKGNNTPLGSTNYRGISYSKGTYHITFSGLEGLQSGEEYFVSIPNNLFYDSQQNYFEGTDETNWRFLGNRKPTKITLIGSTVLENQPAGTVVGTVSGSDSDNGDQTVVTLVGGTHASSFEIVGNQLRTTEELDYEAGATRSITLRATDNAGEYLNSSVTINVGDVDDTAPQVLSRYPDENTVVTDAELEYIEVIFNEDIAFTTDGFDRQLFLKRGSTNQDSWYDAGEGDGPAGSYIVDGNKLRFPLDPIYGGGSTITMILESAYTFGSFAITDLLGNQVSIPSIAFTTRDRYTGNDILSFTADGLSGTAIDPQTRTITGNMSANTTLSLTPNVTLSQGATCLPLTNGQPISFESGVAQDFIVRAENGVEETWSVTLTWPGMAGDFTVGVGGDFTTLRDALDALESRGLSDHVNLVLLDGYTDTPIGFFYIDAYVGSDTYTTTITVAEGASSAQISNRLIFRGAENVTLDGNGILNMVYPTTANEHQMRIEDDDLGTPSQNITIREVVANSVGNVRVDNGSSDILIEDNTFYCSDDNAMIRVVNGHNVRIEGNKFYSTVSEWAIAVFQATGYMQVVNNTIQMVAPGDLYGIYASSFQSLEVYYNTIAIESSVTFSGYDVNAIRLNAGNSAPVIIKNNLFDMIGAGKFTGINYDAAFTNVTIEHNNIAAPFNYFYQFYAEKGADQYGVNDFETVLGLFPYTTNHVVEFEDYANNNLRPGGDSSQEPDLRALPIDGITEDIEGTTRSSAAPTKGAYEIPNGLKDFVSFSISEQVGDVTIDRENHNVSVGVNTNADLTSLTPTFAISPGASIDPLGSGEPNDFSSTASYTITAEDQTEQVWTVDVTRELNTQTDITSWTFSEQTGPAIIDDESHTVTIEVNGFAGESSGRNRLRPTIDLSLGATINPVSGGYGYFNHNVPTIYTVTSEDGMTVQEWQIIVTYAPFAGGTYTIGTNQNFLTPIDAAARISRSGITGNVVLEMQESFSGSSVLLDRFEGTGEHSLTLTVSDDASDLELSIYNIRLRGVENFVFDGKDNLKVIKASNGSAINISALNEFDSDNIQIRNITFSGNGGSGNATNLIVENCTFDTENSGSLSTYSAFNSTGGSSIIRNNQVIVGPEIDQSNILIQGFYITAGEVYNNFIKIAPTLADRVWGIAYNASSNVNIHHNTIVIAGSSSGDEDLNGLHENSARDNAVAIHNNIISITRSPGASGSKTGHKLASRPGATPKPDYAYNNFFLEDNTGALTYVADGGTNYDDVNFSDLQDLVDGITRTQPEFTNVATSDLTLAGSSLTEADFRGIPIATISTDYFGTSRHDTYPSKGAHEVPNRTSDFVTFNIPEQVSDAVIDKNAHTVTVAVNAGTTLTNLVPTFTISPGASIDMDSGDEQDFTDPVTYTIQDEQESHQQPWVVTVSEQNLPPADIALSPSSIDENEEAGTVVGELSASDPNGDDVTFSIVGGEGGEHSYLFEIDADGVTLKSKASFDFEGALGEELNIRIEADDQQGGTTQAPLVVSILDVDEIDPEVDTYSPTNGADGIALNATLIITYNEEVKENSGNYRLISDGQVIENLVIGTPQAVANGQTVTLNPTSNLLYHKEYSIEAFAGVVTDLLDNPAPAIGAGEWTFAAKTIINTLSPADEADDVSPFADLVITFEEPVAKQTDGTFRLFKKSDDSQIGPDWSFNEAVASGSTITFDIPVDLEPDVEVYVNIINGIKDASGNPIDIVGKDTWNFTPVIQSQTVTLNPIGAKTYGNDPFTFTPATSTSGGAIAYTSSNPTVATVEDNLVTIVGAGETVIRATQAGNDYYESAFDEQTFTVNKAPQSISFLGPGNMTYGDANYVLNGSIVPSDDDVAYEIIAGDAVMIDQEELELVIVGTGEVTIKATGSASANYLAPDPVERSFTIYKKTITATPDDDNKVYGEDNPDFTLTYADLANGETADVINTHPTFVTEADASSGVGFYTIGLQGGSDDNYAIQLAEGTLEITKKPLTVRATNKTRSYGDSNPEFSLSYEDFAPGDDESDLDGTLPSLSTAAVPTSVVGEYTISVADDGVDANYEFMPENGTLTVVQAQIDVFVQSAEKNYGDDNPAFELEFDGLKNGESSSVFTTQPIISTVASKYSDVGSYAIEASGAEAQNYTFDYDNSTLTIHKVTVNAEIQDAEWTYGQPNYNFEIVYNGFIAGENEIDLDNAPVVTTDADEFSDVGSYDLIVEGHEDTNYDVIFTDGTLTINPAQQVVEIEDITDKVKNANPFDVMASVNSDTPLQYEVEGPATNDGKTITLTGALGTVTVTVTAPASLNYLEDSEQITFEVNDKQTQTITFSISNQTYGGEVTLAGSSNSNLPVTYEIVSGPLALNNGVLSFTGVGAASVRALQAGDEVYNEAEPVEANFTVQKANLTVTADDQSITYGDEVPSLTFDYDGFVSGEDASVLSETPLASTVATETSDAGTYDISLSGGAADNYTLALVDGTLTIGKATATVTLSDLTFDEDGSAKSPTVVTDPADLTVVLTYNGESEAPSDAGTYEVVVTVDETNYSGSATATLTINEVTVTGVQPTAVEIAVYPNPTSEWLAVSGLTDKLAQLSLIDIDGRVVLSQQVTPKQKINVRSLKAGLYLLQLDQKDFTATTKILIH